MKISSCVRAGILTMGFLNGAWATTTLLSPSTEKIHILVGIADQALEASPDIRAAQTAVEAARMRLEATTRPLNNPELEAEAEHTDISTYKLGISQTIDWHDKRSALENVSHSQLQAAQQQLASLRLSKAVALLEALGRIGTRSAIQRLSQRRSDILVRFSTLASKRHAAGDIAQAELELARLALAEARMQYAQSRASLIQANSDYLALSGQIPKQDIILPESLSIDFPSDSEREAIARQHPKVQVDLLKAQIAKNQIVATDRERRADPTLGVSVGREDDNNLVALRFSMPLQVRNNYQSSVDAARYDALQAEQLAQQTYWQLRAQMISAEERYAVISGVWKQWLSQGRSSLQKRAQLLETLWRAGEISTTDYLLQIQQTLDTEAAGIELQGDLWNAWLAWMNSSAALSNWLNPND